MARRFPLLVLVLAGACGSGSGGMTDPCLHTPTFTNDIRPTIVEMKCIQCHSSMLMGNARHGATEGFDFDTYESTMPHLAEFADAITSGREPPLDLMPPITTTAEEKNTVKLWRTCSFPK